MAWTAANTGATTGPIPESIGVVHPLPGVVYAPAERLRSYVEAGDLPLTTLPEALMVSFAQHADRPALTTATSVLTYAEIDAITDRFAAALLDTGLVPLDRVLFQSANSVELVLAIVGVLKAGLIPVCTLPAHREREIGYLGQHVDARVMIVQGDDAKFDLVSFALKMQAEIPTIDLVVALRGEPRAGVVRFQDLVETQDPATARFAVNGVERDPFQVGVFQLSGGTTGVPKVIPRMQNDYLLNALLTVDHLGYRPDDVMFMPMPMIHNACMICFLLPTLLAGAEFVVADDMTPKAWAAAMAARRPTFLGLIRALSPRLDGALEIDPTLLERTRAIWCPDAARMMRERFGLPTYAMFGMSEGMNMYTAADDPEEARDWTVGRPLSRRDEIRLIVPETDREAEPGEAGELMTRGPYTLSGYYNAPERNAEAFTSDGFYKTGDLLTRRPIGDGFYYSFAGRTRDVVDRGREKINCEEVENAVSTLAAVSGCAIVGMPDPILGERVCAYLVLRAGHPDPGVADLARHLESFGMAKFKWPERVEIIDALPLTKVGKLDKAALRTHIAGKLDVETSSQQAIA